MKINWKQTLIFIFGAFFIFLFVGYPIILAVISALFFGVVILLVNR